MIEQKKEKEFKIFTGSIFDSKEIVKTLCFFGAGLLIVGILIQFDKESTSQIRGFSIFQIITGLIFLASLIFYKFVKNLQYKYFCVVGFLIVIEVIGIFSSIIVMIVQNVKEEASRISYAPGFMTMIFVSGIRY